MFWAAREQVGIKKKCLLALFVRGRHSCARTAIIYPLIKIVVGEKERGLHFAAKGTWKKFCG